MKPNKLLTAENFARTERADEVAEKADQQHGSVYYRPDDDRPARSQPLLPAEPKGDPGSEQIGGAEREAKRFSYFAGASNAARKSYDRGRMTTLDITASPLPEAEHHAQLRRAMIASTVGTIIEWYDFLLYGPGLMWKAAVV